jgi:hypothetical protein
MSSVSWKKLYLSTDPRNEQKLSRPLYIMPETEVTTKQEIQWNGTVWIPEDPKPQLSEEVTYVLHVDENPLNYDL